MKGACHMRTVILRETNDLNRNSRKVPPHARNRSSKNLLQKTEN